MGKTASAFLAIVGRPNVGKSSLLNRFVGEKVAIVSPKPQTTRTRITGVLTQEAVSYTHLDVYKRQGKPEGRIIRCRNGSCRAGSH